VLAYTNVFLLTARPKRDAPGLDYQAGRVVIPDCRARRTDGARFNLSGRILPQSFKAGSEPGRYAVRTSRSRVQHSPGQRAAQARLSSKSTLQTFLTDV
jgi:hypothetical protein